MSPFRSEAPRPPPSAGAEGQTSARQTFATGKEWYDYLAAKYGAANVEWTSGSGRTVQWSSRLPLPGVNEMLRTRPLPRSSAFVKDIMGPKPTGSVAHHKQFLGLGGPDNGTTNGAWVPYPDHVAGHAEMSEVNRLPYGTWVIPIL